MKARRGEPTAVRGGRAKTYFRVTARGLRQARRARATLTGLWDGLPQLEGTDTMSTKPPVVALWLLTRLVSGPSREALLGDLVEQHARGKSSAWFWKETLAAIGASVAAEARAHYGVVSAIAFFVGLHVAPQRSAP